MVKEKIPRIDSNEKVRNLLLSYCRLKYGDIWEDPVGGHRMGCQ